MAIDGAAIYQGIHASWLDDLKSYFDEATAGDKDSIHGQFFEDGLGIRVQVDDSKKDQWLFDIPASQFRDVFENPERYSQSGEVDTFPGSRRMIGHGISRIFLGQLSERENKCHLAVS